MLKISPFFQLQILFAIIEQTLYRIYVIIAVFSSQVFGPALLVDIFHSDSARVKFMQVFHRYHLMDLSRNRVHF